MKTLRNIKYAGIASVAIALASPAVTLAESQLGASTGADKSGNTIHRVSHSLAASQKYSVSTGAGYKWGKKAQATDSKAIWADSAPVHGGNKWGASNASVDQSAAPSFAEQSGKRWGRRDFAEQSGYRWGRRDFAEQSGYRWGRRDFAEQSGYRWGRRDFAEQSGYRWGRRDFAEQSGYRWGRRNFVEQSGYRWGRR